MQLAHLQTVGTPLSFHAMGECWGATKWQLGALTAKKWYGIHGVGIQVKKLGCLRGRGKVGGGGGGAGGAGRGNAKAIHEKRAESTLGGLGGNWYTRLKPGANGGSV